MAHGLVATVLLPALISSLGINQEPYISQESKERITGQARAGELHTHNTDTQPHRQTCRRTDIQAQTHKHAHTHHTPKQTHKHTDTQTHGQTYRHTGTHTQPHRHTDTQTDVQTHNHIGTPTHTNTHTPHTQRNTQTHRHTDTQTDLQTYRHTHASTTPSHTTPPRVDSLGGARVRCCGALCTCSLLWCWVRWCGVSTVSPNTQQKPAQNIRSVHSTFQTQLSKAKFNTRRNTTSNTTQTNKQYKQTRACLCYWDIRNHNRTSEDICIDVHIHCLWSPCSPQSQLVEHN